MSEPITCFWVEQTGEAQRDLRRWVSNHNDVTPPDLPACTNGRWYHSATVIIERAPLEMSPEGHIAAIDPALYKDDPRWPTACEACGWQFPPITRWDGVSRFDGSINLQVNQEPIYKQPGSLPGECEWPQHQLPAGAMWDADWLHGWHMGGDGISLMVVTSWQGKDNRGACWCPDGTANNGTGPPPHWQRTGDPKVGGSITATPSILTGQYHGWLRNGQLVEA